MTRTYFRRVDDWSSLVQAFQFQFGTMTTLSFLWGLQIYLFYQCICPLWDSRRKSARAHVLFWLTTILFLLANCWNFFTIVSCSAFLIDSKTPLPGLTWSALQRISGDVSATANALVQSFTIWRCYVVFLAGWKNPSRKVLYSLRILMALAFLATYGATAFHYIAKSGTIKSLLPILTASGVTLLCATTIIVRLVQYRQRGFLVVSSNTSSEDSAPSSPLGFILSLLIESGGLYALCMLAFVMMLHIHAYSVTLDFSDLYYTTVAGALRPQEPWRFYNIVYFCAPAVQVIAAYLALFRVANGRAVSRDTLVSPIVLEEHSSKKEIIFDEYSDAV